LQAGRVLIGGTLVADGRTDTPPEHRGVGLVFQDMALFPHLSVWENVAFGLRRLKSGERRQRVGATLERVGIADLAASFPHMLSGGQQQRVALARALAPQPRIMLLDEPFSGLDARLRDQVRDDTLHLLQDSGTATLLVTHDPEEAMFMADRIAVMREGRLAQVGRPADLYLRPASDFVARFFGEVNRIDGMVIQRFVATPLGPVAAPDLADGTPVQVLIRPEGLLLTAAEPGSYTQTQSGGGLPPRVAQIQASRLLGRTSLVHLSLDVADDGSATPLHLHARVPGVYDRIAGAHVAVTMNPAHTFVFARDSQHDRQGRPGEVGGGGGMAASR
ncbi:MAG: ABC transporter ATP-binding protein, partial [Alphaproteobacteria bacterium]